MVQEGAGVEKTGRIIGEKIEGFWFGRGEFYSPKISFDPFQGLFS